MDWRAEAARPFYLATAASPGDVRVRRHITTRDRKLISYDDEVLDLAVADPSRHEGLTGESALLAALNASRTGTMSDIVETIQAEQDHIIRSPWTASWSSRAGPAPARPPWPCTGPPTCSTPTAASSRSAACSWSARTPPSCATSAQVLPSLGETSVLLSTVGDLYPGISATGHRAAAGPPRSRASSAWPRWWPPPSATASRRRASPIRLTIDRPSSSRWPAGAVAGPASAPAGPGGPHNLARAVFAREIISALTSQFAAQLGRNVLGGPNLLGARGVDDLRGRAARRAGGAGALIERLWPVLLAAAAPHRPVRLEAAGWPPPRPA